MRSVTSQVRAEFQRYGQSNNTNPNFVWPQFVRYNAVAKAQVLGESSDLDVTLKGCIGSQVGTQTLYFTAKLPEPCFVRYVLLEENQYIRKYLSINALDANYNLVAINRYGYLTADPADELVKDLERMRMPAGQLFFSISSSEWERLPFELSLQIFQAMKRQDLPKASLTQAGIVQLSKSLYSEDDAMASTPSATRASYALANQASYEAGASKNTAEAAKLESATAYTAAQKAEKLAEGALATDGGIENLPPLPTDS